MYLSQDKVLSLILPENFKTNRKIHENKIEINDLKESELNNLLKNKFIAAALFIQTLELLLINPFEVKEITIENKYNLAISHSRQEKR
jgi:hypothetical protein